MISCLLFSVAIAFPFMNWRHEPEGRLKPHHLVNVSIFMLKRPPPPEGLWYSIDLTDLLLKQGWSERNSSLIPTTWQIYQVNYAIVSGITSPTCQYCAEYNHLNLTRHLP